MPSGPRVVLHSVASETHGHINICMPTDEVVMVLFGAGTAVAESAAAGVTPDKAAAQSADASALNASARLTNRCSLGCMGSS